MSTTLLKRSLGIVEDNVNKKQKKDNIQQTQLNNKRYTNHQKKKSLPYNYSNKKTTIDDIKNKIDNVNLAKENMEKLLKLSQYGNHKSDLDSKTVKKLVQRAQSKRYILNIDTAKAEEQTSIFTEEDFQNFEKEYFPTK